MWSPTHVQVTIYRAKNLILKGKSGTNDAYVTIKLGDEKYQTSIKERSVDPDWMEECDLPLTDPQGVVHLNVYHRNLLGIDEFLGHLDIPLEDFNIYDRPRSRWYALRNKSSSKKPEKYRGEIEVKITFIVQSVTGSQASLTKKGSFKRSSSIKTLAQSVGEKLTKNWPSKGSLTLSGSRPDLSSTNSDTGDYSPTVRKIDKKGLTRSHTILPTSFNNQHLQEVEQSHDDVDSVKAKENKGQDFDRWQNPLAPFRRKKKSRLSKMSLLSQSTHTLDNMSEPPNEDIEEEDKEDCLAQLRHRPLLAKSMFDLSTPSFDELDVASKDMSTSAHDGKHVSEDVHPVKAGSQYSESAEKPVSPLAAGQDSDNQLVVPAAVVCDGGDQPCPYQERAIDVVFPTTTNGPQDNLTNTAPDPQPLTSLAPSNKVMVKPPKPPRAAQSGSHGNTDGQGYAELSEGQNNMDTTIAKTEVFKDNVQETVLEKETDKAMNTTGSDAISMDSKQAGLTSSNVTDIATENNKKDQSLCYISSSESDLTMSAESSPKKQNQLNTAAGDGQSTEQVDETSNTKDDNTGQLKAAESDQSLSEQKDRKMGSGEERQRDRVEKYKKMKDVNRRHTMQYGKHNVPRATAHDLHEGIMEYQQRALENKDRDLPPEIIEQFSDKSREDLIRMVLELNTQLHKKEQYNRDLENYIDNLLVKVMEVTPKLLQHPNSHSPSQIVRSTNNSRVTNGVSSYGTAPRSTSRKSCAPSSNSPTKDHVNQMENVNNSNNRVNNIDFIQQNNKTNKKPFNPFKKLQQALK